MKEIFPIHLFSMPDNIYVKLDDDFRKRFFQSSIKLAGNKRRLSNVLNIKYTTFLNWFSHSFCPLKMLKLISVTFENRDPIFSERMIEKHVIELRGKTMPFGIKNPRLPIELNEQLAIFLGHLYGDGGIKKRDKDPLYCNIYAELIDEFLNSLMVFGDVDYRRSINEENGLINIRMPSVLGNILIHRFGFPAGKKSKIRNVRIPDFIKNAKDERIRIAFLRALYDDEGHVNLTSRTIKIEMANKELIEDINFLLKEIGFYPGKIVIQHHKHSKEWAFGIYNKFNFRLFEKKIGFTTLSKRKALHNLASQFTRNPNPYILLPKDTRKYIFEHVGENAMQVKSLLEKKIKNTIPYMTVNQWYYGKRPIPLNVLQILLKFNNMKLFLNGKVRITHVANSRYKIYLDPEKFREFIKEESDNEVILCS